MCRLDLAAFWWGWHLVQPHGVGNYIVVVPTAGGLGVHLLLEDQSLCTANAVDSSANGCASSILHGPCSSAVRSRG